MVFKYTKSNRCVTLARKLTNGSRGTTNAWHFYYALVFVVTVLCGKLVVALVAP
ncbi:DUF3265 domain-containing protein [Vibrio metschnikovii]|nr:DUF3265 domain-containing protein [Vibrio metschnikovii]